MSAPSTPSSLPKPLPPSPSVRQRVRVYATRTATLVVLCVALYVVVGSFSFGGWWYGFFWDGRFADLRWTTVGLRLLLHWHPFVVTVLVVSGLILFFAVTLIPRWLLAVLDRFRRHIVVGSVTAVVIAALVLYFAPGDTVQAYIAILSVRNATPESFNAGLEARLEQPGIDAPIYFHYVNSEAVDILYNQLKPELEETSRDIKSTASVKGGAEVTAGNGKISIEGNKSGEEESKYNRPSFLPARECLEVMKYVRKTWPTNYYADYNDWWSKYTTTRILHAGSDESIYDPQDPLKAPDNPKEDLTHQAAENARRAINKLKDQLSTVHGLVFVDGDFEKSMEGNNVVLMHALAIPEKMPKLDATFKIVLPKAAVQSLPAGKPLRLRVFGDVTKPLGKDGFINVAPVAIF